MAFGTMSPLLSMFGSSQQDTTQTQQPVGPQPAETVSLLAKAGAAGGLPGLGIGQGILKGIELGQAGYLEDQLKMMFLGKLLSEAPGFLFPGLRGMTGTSLPISMFFAGGINKLNAPFLEKAGLISGEPEKLVYPYAYPRPKESWVEKTPKVFQGGGTVPEYIRGRGATTGREYMFEPGEQVFDPRFPMGGGYDRMGAVTAAGAPMGTQPAGQPPTADVINALGTQSAPTAQDGKGFFAMFRDPNIQHLLGRMGAAISPEGSAQQQLGATVAELAKQQAASKYLKQRQAQLMQQLGISQPGAAGQQAQGMAAQSPTASTARPAPMTMPQMPLGYNPQQLATLDQMAMQQAMMPMQIEQAQQRQTYERQLTAESRMRTAKGEWEKIPEVYLPGENFPRIAHRNVLTNEVQIGLPSGLPAKPEKDYTYRVFGDEIVRIDKSGEIKTIDKKELTETQKMMAIEDEIAKRIDQYATTTLLDRWGKPYKVEEDPEKAEQIRKQVIEQFIQTGFITGNESWVNRPIEELPGLRDIFGTVKSALKMATFGAKQAQRLLSEDQIREFEAEYPGAKFLRIEDNVEIWQMPDGTLKRVRWE